MYNNNSSLEQLNHEADRLIEMARQAYMQLRADKFILQFVPRADKLKD